MPVAAAIKSTMDKWRSRNCYNIVELLLRHMLFHLCYNLIHGATQLRSLSIYLCYKYSVRLHSQIKIVYVNCMRWKVRLSQSLGKLSAQRFVSTMTDVNKLQSFFQQFFFFALSLSILVASASAELNGLKPMLVNLRLE